MSCSFLSREKKLLGEKWPQKKLGGVVAVQTEVFKERVQEEQIEIYNLHLDVKINYDLLISCGNIVY